MPNLEAKPGTHFGRAWAATMDFVAEDFVATSRPFGLALADTWVFAHVRNTDGEDSAPHLVRSIRGGTTTGCMVATAQPDGVYYHPQAGEFLRGGSARRVVDADGALRVSGSMGYYAPPGGAEFEAVIGKTGFEWRDGGHLSLTGRRLGPAMGFMLPHMGEETVFFVSNFFEVEGEVFGRSVRGIGAFENAWLAPGRQWSDGPVLKRFEAAWCAFANVFEDGAVQYGHLCGYADGMAFADIYDEGRHITGVIVAVDVEFNSDGFVRRAVYTLESGDQWEFNIEPRGALRDQWAGAQRAGQNFRCQKGTANRVGDTRQRRSFYAILEAFPERLGLPADPSIRQASSSAVLF